MKKINNDNITTHQKLEQAFGKIEKSDFIDEAKTRKDLRDKWISVDELKPNYYQVCLCFYNGAYTLCWRGNNGGVDFYTIAGTDNVFEGITHWMPLPEPPKEFSNLQTP